MSDINDIVAYIDEYYQNAARRPKMFFSSPEAFEDVVFALESVRDIAIFGKSSSSNSTYAAYLISCGFGSARFTSRYREEHAGVEDGGDGIWGAYACFLMDYLADRRTAHNQ